MGGGRQVESVGWIQSSLASRILFLHNFALLPCRFWLGFAGCMRARVGTKDWSIWSIGLGKLPLREFLHAAHIAEDVHN